MLSAILFDLDGTIVNTDPIHYDVWREILLEYQVEINEKIYNSNFTGRLNPEIIKDILPDLSIIENQKLADEKEARFRSKASLLKPINGFTDLLSWSKEHNLKRALVTNAPKLNAHFMIEALELEQAFDIVILAEEESKAKPDPTPYKVALKKLGISQSDAIAIEDSPSGVRSAVAAGIRTVGITSTQKPSILQGMGVFMTISDFSDVEFWNFLNYQFNQQVNI